MSKLFEWLLGAITFLFIWFLMITNSFQSRLIEEWMAIVIVLPIIIIGLFGVSCDIMSCNRKSY